MTVQAAAPSSPWQALLAAVQFLTRIPVGPAAYNDQTLPAALAYFPVVGLVLGAVAALADRLILPHLGALVAALCALALLVLVTGGLHEDGLADCADAFGSRHPLAKTLEILRDSRIGSFGALALTLSLGARIFLIAALPSSRIFPFLITAHVLCRWSALPLTLLPAARTDGGQGVRVARRVPRTSLILGTVLTFSITGIALRTMALPAVLACCAITGLSAWFYWRRLRGITGDCFGATNQLVEMAVLACGAWVK